MLTWKFHHMLPSDDLKCEFGVLIKCCGILLKFSPFFTFHLRLSHFWTSYLVSNLPLIRTSWHCLGTFVVLNVYLPDYIWCLSLLLHFLFSLSLLSAILFNLPRYHLNIHRTIQIPLSFTAYHTNLFTLFLSYKKDERALPETFYPQDVLSPHKLCFEELTLLYGCEGKWKNRETCPVKWISRLERIRNERDRKIMEGRWKCNRRHT
jgi:hypothetical protein